MHPQAEAWLVEQVEKRGLEGCDRVLDLGGRDVNGTIHRLFAKVRTLDLVPGEGVDIVGDAATWQPDELYEVVLCTEVFEHEARWRQIIATAYEALEPGGVLLATCASRQRPPHSALDGGPLRRGEWYQNVGPSEMDRALRTAGFNLHDVIAADGVFGDDDLYCWAVR